MQGLSRESFNFGPTRAERGMVPAFEGIDGLADAMCITVRLTFDDSGLIDGRRIARRRGYLQILLLLLSCTGR